MSFPVAGLTWGDRLLAIGAAALVAAGGGAVGSRATDSRVAALETVVSERARYEEAAVPVDVARQAWRTAVEGRLGAIEGELKGLVTAVQALVEREMDHGG